MTTEEIVAALAEALEATAHWCQHEPCTTCLVISDEDFDAQIGAVAMHGKTPTWVEGKPLSFAAALLPTVRHIAEQRAAEELLAAAEELHVARFNALGDPETRWPAGSEQVRPDNFYRGITLATLALKFRAAALTATPNHGTDVTT